MGQYFDDTSFGEYITGQVDPGVDFTWPGGVSPLAGVRESTFSVRWSGQVDPPCTDTYTFSTLSDDGVRLWVNGTLLIDRWDDHNVTTDTGNIALTAGVPVSIVLEFYESYGNARIQLAWSAPGCVPSTVAIPVSQLYPAPNAPPTPSATPTALPSWSCPIADSFSSGPLNGQWTGKDISAMIPGSQIVGSNLAISADGRGIHGAVFGEAASGDSFRFVYQPVWGDFDLRLQVHGVPTSVGGQAGLMLRESVESGAKQVFAGASQTGVFQQVQRLSTNAGNSLSSGGTFVNGTPQWVRLQRSGNVVQTYYSPNGSTWTSLGAPVNFGSLSTSLLVGVAASSQDVTVLGQAQVSNFEVLSAGCQTATPTITATSTASPTWSASPSGTHTPTITQSFTHSPTFSETATITPSPSNTPSYSVSPTFSDTATATPSPTQTPSFSASPTFSLTATFSASPSITPTFSVSPTYTATPARPLSSLVVYPNPFSDRLWIGFTLGGPSRLELLAYNVAGEEVYRTSLDAPTGTQTLSWDGINTQGSKLASGVYLLRLRADGGAVGWESQWATVALIR